ncbi:MAG TPA: SDR family NAD(P)-dependent oxidoreductase [Bacteroidota bacterium]|nr:SDR family NAD(P)-dependent oxidoreductase [Bacteroidota bacterium]
MDLTGNTILITGGTSGIGLAMAEFFLKEKNHVLICGRRDARLHAIQRRAPAIHVKTCDIVKEADRRNLVEWATSNFPDLNVLVNNAGIQREIDFTKGIAEYWAGENEIATNLEAPIVLTGMLIPLLKGKRGAAIINVTSGLGFVPGARVPVYSATKAAMHAYSMALRNQLSKTGIRVYEVVPPAVDTELNPEGRARRPGFTIDLKPREFVEGIMEGLKADRAEVGFGATEGHLKASREELNKSFEMMNSRW